MIVDFGLNPNFFGTILSEPLKLESRIILSNDAAKRLMLHLANAIQSYEAKYGVIELDVVQASLSRRRIDRGRVSWRF